MGLGSRGVSALGALLSLLLLSALAAPAWGAGTVVVIFNVTNLLGDNGFWVIPDPTNTDPGLPPACTNFPQGFNPVSGKVWWNSADGATPCTSLVFYNGPACTGSNTGIRRPNDTAAPITTDNDYSLTVYPGVMKAVSIGCTADMCTPQTCPSPGQCAYDPLKGTFCQCPSKWNYDTSSAMCVEQSGSAKWLPVLNYVRQKGMPKAAPLAWDMNLEQAAQNWTDTVKSAQCGKSSVTLTKMPGAAHSENDVYISFSTKETDAVIAWSPNATDYSNIRTMRILDENTKKVGCGRSVCNGGGFFTCLFSPILY